MAPIQSPFRSIRSPFSRYGNSSAGGVVGLFDYIITNDAQWGTIPAGLLSSGGNVGVAPGNYTAKTLTATPTGRLRFAATDPNNKPVIDRLVLSSTARLTFEDMRLVCSTWANADTTAASVLFTTGVSVEPIFRRCDIWGNYRGTVGVDVDVVNALPEYACIAADVTAGAISALEITQSFVGDLMADGTYNLDFAPAGGTGATATFTVASGVITGTSLTAGGSGYNTNSHRTRRAVWNGQRRMLDWLPWGFRSASPGGVQNPVFEDCNIKTVANAIKPSGMRTGLTVRGCNFSRIYMDYIATGLDDSQLTPFPVTIEDNFLTLPFSIAGRDAGDPHSDGILQLYMDDLGGTISTADWPDVKVERNIFIDGVCRGGVQGIFLTDAPNTVSFSGMRVVGNVILSKSLTNGLVITNPRDVYVRNNIVARYDPTDTTSNTSAVNMVIPAARDVPGGFFAGGTSLIGNNIVEGLQNNGYGIPEIDIVREPNVILGQNGATISYASAFADHTSASRTTIAGIAAAYAPQAGYAGKGAFANTSYINHAARTTDVTLEPTFVRFLDLTGQTASTTVTSNWTKAIGGPATRSISITGGEYRIADDASGTNATTWGSASGTLTRDKFVQIRRTSGTGGQTVTVTLTIGSDAYVWSITSASTASFVTIDNGGTAYSRSNAVPDETGQLKLILAFRMKPDALTANANFLASTDNTGFRVWTPTTTAFRANIVGSTRAQLRPPLTATTAMRTHIITLDFTNTTANAGCRWATIEDGMLLTDTPGTGGVFDTRSVAGSGTDYGAYAGFGLTGTGKMFSLAGQIGVFAEADGGGILLDGAFDFLWMDWGTSGYTIPDITNSTNRSAWLADNIGANGQGPTGSQPKIYWTAASLTEANSGGGIPNLGSLSAFPLIKQAGTYA